MVDWLPAVVRGISRANPLLFAMILVVAVLVQITRRLPLTGPEDPGGQPPTWSRRDWGLVLLGLSTMLIVISLRLLVYPGPSGFDTPNYLFYAQEIMQLNLRFLFESLHPLPNLVAGLLVVGLGFNLDWAGVLLPYIASLPLPIATYYAVRLHSGGRITPAVAMLVTPFSYAFVRLSYDLYGQLMSLPLILVLLSRIAFTAQRQAVRRVDPAEVLLMGLLLLTYPIAYMIIIGVLGLAILFQLLPSPVRNPPLAVRLLWKLGVNLVFLGVLLPFLIIMKGSLVQVLLTSDLRLFTPPANWLWVLVSESPMLLGLGAAEAFLLLRPRSRRPSLFETMVLNEFLLIYLLIIVSGYAQPYRLVLFAPFAILAAGVFQRLAESGPIITATRRTIDLKKPVAALLIIGVVLAAAPSLTIPVYVYRPTDPQLAQLYWIRDAYGYGNSSCRVLLQDPISFTFNWAVAITGPIVLQGNLTQHLGLLNSSSNQDVTTLLIPDSLYNLSAFELNLAAFSRNGVYVIVLP